MTVPAEERPILPLSDDESRLLQRLRQKLSGETQKLQLLEGYRDGKQRLRRMGIAVPPELRDFETIINIPGMAVNEPVSRQDLRGFQRSTSDVVDEGLQEAWEFNNLEAQSMLVHADARAFGRAYVVVTRGDDPEQPLITSVSPIGMATISDVVNRRLIGALREWQDYDRRKHAVLYTPDATIELVREKRWEIVERYDHRLGVVPIVQFLNRQWQDRENGCSEMCDVIGMTDAIARMVTNMQLAGETIAIPHRWATGAAKEDFFDREGRPLPTWQAYMTVIQATRNPNAKFGAYPTADLDNFNKAVNNMLAWCGSMLGLPTRYMGQQTVNPAAEGAIIADEIRLIKNVERMNRFDGAAWSWVMGLREYLRTGEPVPANDIRALWFNPATPTYSQRAEAVFKMTTGSTPILSREGAWDELGWSVERKNRERQYLREQQSDPTLALAAQLMGGINDQPIDA